MGHFSRFIPPGSKRIALQNKVQPHMPPLEAGDVKNGQALVFEPCDSKSAVQQWSLDTSGSMIVHGTDSAEGSDGYQHDGECVDLATDAWTPKLQVWACAHSDNQLWALRAVPGGSRVVNVP